MNYRHHFHAGNFADVMKHVMLIALFRALQAKPKGFLFLDTHAGRGKYDLDTASAGQTSARQPEWPQGIGRLWQLASETVPIGVAEYLRLVREFDRAEGNITPQIRFYPGSPVIARLLARPVERLALCEKHPGETEALRREMGRAERTSVHELDGYIAVRSMLPPLEKRAFVLIDPPFESEDEFAQIAAAVGPVLPRAPAATIAIWYPFTGRARVDEFFMALRQLSLPPTLACELAVAGVDAPIKMRGCGLIVLNPPWQFDATAKPMLTFLAETLAQGRGAGAQVSWIVPEK